MFRFNIYECNMNGIPENIMFDEKYLSETIFQTHLYI